MKKTPILLLMIALGCTKSATKGPTGGSGNLLTKEVLTAQDASGATLDSVTTTFQYNSQNQVSQLQQTSIASLSGTASSTIVATYNFTYSGAQATGFTGTVVETLKSPLLTESSTTTVSTTFEYSGGRIVEFSQQATSNNTPVLGVTAYTGNDSANINYDANGNITSYNMFINQNSVNNTYETFTYTAGNLTQSVLVVFVGGVPTDTTTTTYTYDTKLSPVPSYLFPGVAIPSLNDVTSSDMVTTGINAQTVATTYTTTYNSSNQPVTSSGTVVETPTSQYAFTHETIAYTYQ
jgi:hypothetical protein